MRLRLIVSYVSLTAVVLVLLGIPLGLNFADHQRDEIASRLQRDAFVLATFSAETLAGRDSVDLGHLVHTYTEETGGRVVIVNASGAMRADSDPPVAGQRSFASRPEISAALDGQVVAGTRRSSTLGSGLFYVAVPVMAGGDLEGAVRITYPADHVDAQVQRYVITLAATGLVALAAAGGIGMLFARWVSRPIEDLTETSIRLGGGDLSARSSTTAGPPEVRELAGAFNVTAARLEELISAQEQFVADASHQLRTPLTALRLRLEMIEQAVTDAASGDSDVATDVVAAHKEVQRLSRLVDGLLTLARADRASATSTAETIDLDGFLAERRDTWAMLASEHDVGIVTIASGLSVRATPDRLTQVIDNLLANAIEASPPGSAITLMAAQVFSDDVGGGSDTNLGDRAGDHAGDRAADHAGDQDGNQVEIRVVDQGPGLPDEIRAHVFDRFKRFGPPTSELGGSGLGLAIARKLTLADGGTIELAANDDGGISAVVQLPGVS